MGDLISVCKSECNKLLSNENEFLTESNSNAIGNVKNIKKVNFKEFVKRKTVDKNDIFRKPTTLNDLKRMSIEYIQIIKIIKIQRFIRRKLSMKNYNINSKPNKSNLKKEKILDNETISKPITNFNTKNRNMVSLKEIKLIKEQVKNKENNFTLSKDSIYSTNEIKEDVKLKNASKTLRETSKSQNFNRIESNKIKDPDNGEDSLSFKSDFYSVNSDITFGFGNKESSNFTKNFSGFRSDWNGINKIKPSILLEYEENNFSILNITDENVISRMDDKSFSVINFRNNTVYKGVVNDELLPNDKGILKLKSDYYKGEFKNGKINGFGEFNTKSNLNYIGYWSNNTLNGYGIEKSCDGCMYIGEYSNGKKEGIGLYSWNDSAKYEGNWKNNSFNGYGIFTFSNGNQYLGEWSNNKMEGYGEFYWIDAKFFVGNFQQSKRNGFGIYVWGSPTNVYIGYWKNNKKHGLGKIISSKSVKISIYNDGEKEYELENFDAFYMTDFYSRNKLNKSYINKFFNMTITELFELLNIS